MGTHSACQIGPIVPYSEMMILSMAARWGLIVLFSEMGPDVGFQDRLRRACVGHWDVGFKLDA
jgi:hypothetical protein